MSNPIDDIEKLHGVASRAVADLQRAIEAHTGIDLQKMQMTGNGYVECFVNWTKVTNGFCSIEEMMAEIKHSDRRAKEWKAKS